MKISEKLFLLLCLAINICTVLAMENISRLPKILQDNPYLCPKEDSEKLLDSGSFFPENSPVLDFVIIAEKSDDNKIIREHYLINNEPYKNFVYSKNTIIPYNTKNRSEAIQELVVENYQKSEKLIQEREKNNRLTADLTKLKNSYLNSFIWAGTILISSLVIGGIIAYCHQPSIALNRGNG